MKTTHDPRPIPGAIDGTPWHVKTMPTAAEGTSRVHGYTDHGTHTMAVPAAPSTRARWVALHELAHAKFTPAKSKPSAILKKHAPATHVDLQVIEDLRVNSRLHHARLLNIPRDDAEALTETALHWARSFTKPEARPELLEVLTLSLLQAGHLPRGHRLLHLDGAPIGTEHKLALRLFLDAVAAEAARLGRNVESETALARALAEKSLEIARAAAAMLIPKRQRWNDPLPHKLIGPAAAMLRRLLEAEKELQQQPDNKPGHIRPSKSERAGQWGTLDDLPAVPLTETSPAVTAHRRKIAAPVGPRLRSIRRLLTDGRAFARTITKPMKGGTVLIDTSGSMRLDPERLHEVLAQIPAATIAIYSGRGRKGAVSVIAKNGRVASRAAIEERMSTAGFGNIVDGPALAWLGKQAEPRLWVCDGVVTGCGDVNCRVLDREAEALRRRHSIARFDTLRELTEHLTEAHR